MLTHSYPMTAYGDKEDFTKHNTLTSKDFLSSSACERIILYPPYTDALLNTPVVTVYNGYSTVMFHLWTANDSVLPPSVPHAELHTYYPTCIALKYSV